MREAIVHDLSSAIRQLRRRPGFALLIVLILGLSIGANTAIFSIADSLLLRPLPVREPDRLVLVVDQGVPTWGYRAWRDFSSRPELFDGSFAWDDDRLNLNPGGQADYVEGLYASGGIFRALGISAILGRTFDESDDLEGGGLEGPVALVSHGFWQRRFGGSPDVIGRSLTIERVSFTIIGVTPATFFGPEVGRTFDVILPLGTEPLIRGRASVFVLPNRAGLGIMARLKPGQTLEAATQTLRAIEPAERGEMKPASWDAERMAEYARQPWKLEPAARGHSSMRASTQEPLTVLMFVVALVLLIACANVANLMLARATSRRHELSVRRGLGASGFRLARQFLVESLLLAGAGAALGLVLARFGSHLLVDQWSSMTSTVFIDLPLDGRVLGFSAAAAVGTALLFGTVPALRAARVQAGEALKEEGPVLAGRRRTGLGNALVVTQVALSLVLVVAAGLFVQTFSALATLDVGFDRSRILVATIEATNSQARPTERLEVLEEIRRSVASIPGVAHTAAGLETPIDPTGSWGLPVSLADGPPMAEEDPWIHTNYVTTDWLATYGTELVAGRDFTESDGFHTPLVAIVNEAFVRQYLGGRSALGTRIRSRQLETPVEIVGIAEDVVYYSQRSPASPMIYLPLSEMSKGLFAHTPPWPLSVSIRAENGPPSMLVRRVAATIGRIDPAFVLTVRPLSNQVNAKLVQERFLAILSSCFGALALLIAGLGLFAMTSYAVAQRRAEVGIRMALGAAPDAVVRLVLRRVALLVGLGVVIGGAVSLWAAPFAETFLFGLEPRDPATFITATLTLAVVGAVAGWWPARSASRTDPKSALRTG
jgi:predicted permease